jgi:hypothetical protein
VDVPHIPPRKHLRKVQNRLARVEEMGCHEYLRPRGGVPMPDRRTRGAYIEQLELLFRDIDRILFDLLEDEVSEEHDQY